MSMMISGICARYEGLAAYIALPALNINIVFAGTLLPLNQVGHSLSWMHYLAFTYYATVAYNQNQYRG